MRYAIDNRLAPSFRSSPPDLSSITTPPITEACGAAVDAGLLLPNVNDGYTGRAPDLGAYELGQPDVVYGPRPQCGAPPPPGVFSPCLVAGFLPCVGRRAGEAPV